VAKNPSQVYLDNNATTELSETAAAAVMDLVISGVFGNPSSKHTFGRGVREIVETSRLVIADSLNCPPGCLIFTGSGSEANNLAINGVCLSEDPPNEIAISAGEHSSVYNTALELVGDSRFVVIPLTADGVVDLKAAERLITDRTLLVSVMLANNETGVIFQIPEIVKMAHAVGAIVHCDAVQAYSKMPIDLKKLNVDLMSISGHKAHALPGIGALYVRKGIYLRPLIMGGAHEFGLRAGTENYFGIASLAAAAEEIIDSGYPSPSLRDAFELGLKNAFPGIVTINGEGSPRLPNTSSVTFRGISSVSLLAALDYKGVAASAGSACSSGFIQPSPTLLAMGRTEEEALSTIRFSLSKYTTIEDITFALNACISAIETFSSSTVIK
jgi:cysteine desulfurase